MTNDELVEQFKRCEGWSDPDQWEFLAMAYYSRGYWLNALHCFKRANRARAAQADITLRGESPIQTIQRVAMETEA